MCVCVCGRGEIGWEGVSGGRGACVFKEKRREGVLEEEGECECVEKERIREC